MQKNTFTVNAQIKMRLDLFLVETLGKSRSFCVKSIKNGVILVNKKIEKKPGHLVFAGDTVSILELKEKSDSNIVFLKPKIVFENNDFLVVDKPAGMLVHKTAKNEKNTLVDYLLKNFSFAKNFEDRAGIVHRLDKDTSGLLIVAKTIKTKEELQKLFKERRIKKTYLALVFGAPKHKEGIIDAPLSRGAEKSVKMSIVANGSGKESLTNFRIKKRFKDFSLLEVEIKTGRTHQIRVHLAAINCPVVGESLYAKRKKQRESQKLGLSRQFLHAFKLEFTLNKQKFKFESKLPEDLSVFLEKLNEI